jgi:amidase
MGRTVADVALLLTAMAAADEGDPASAAAAGQRPQDYTTALDAAALKGRRLGILRQSMGFHPTVDRAMETAFTALRGAGAELVDVKIATYDRWNDAELEVLLFEFKDGLNRYLAESGAPHKTLEALIAWNRDNADRVMPYFGQELFERAQAKGPLTDPAYIKARDAARRLAGEDGLLATLERDKLDAIVAPSTSPAWPIDYVLGDRFLGAGYGIAAVAGTPSITVPIGESHGLPFGLTIMGPAFSERQLISFAYALEQLTKARRPPEFKPTIAP